mmetsp:Transcript_39652/g.35402  ORF Transcript_39652/g.35402 Transcript_39652/m.35402 type:complete len:109 (-) Transcript_39652:337-663(-)
MINITPESQVSKDYFGTIDEAFQKCNKPIISLVNGVALGGGLELALASDIILMAEDARIGLPEITLGVIPGIGGTQRLTHIVGKHTAMKMITTGEFIPAKEAYRLGIC